MADKRKPLGHVESMLEETRYKKIEHYRLSKEHSLQGDVLSMIESDLIDVLSAERGKTPQADGGAES